MTREITARRLMVWDARNWMSSRRSRMGSGGSPLIRVDISEPPPVASVHGLPVDESSNHHQDQRERREGAAFGPDRIAEFHGDGRRQRRTR